MLTRARTLKTCTTNHNNQTWYKIGVWVQHSNFQIEETIWTPCTASSHETSTKRVRIVVDSSSLSEEVQLPRAKRVRVSLSVMPHGTTHLPQVRLCGQFTAHTALRWKKMSFFLSLFVPLSPLCSTLLPSGQNNFIFYQKKNTGCPKNRGKHDKCLHQLQWRSLDLCRPGQRTTIHQ